MGEIVKHTPAKWADIKGYIVVKGGHTIASVNSYNTFEGKANARLIAAAPDLLAALKEAVDFANKANNYIAGQDLPASAGWLAAIAKAEARP